MVISKRVLSSARRVDQSGVRPRAGQGDRQSVTTRQGELALGLPFPVWTLVTRRPSSALFTPLQRQRGHRPPCLPAA